MGEAGRDMLFGPVRSIYLFHTAPTFQPYAFRFDSGYDILHNDLKHQGKLDHALDVCPERLHPQPVRVWAPTASSEFHVVLLVEIELVKRLIEVGWIKIEK